MGYLLLPSTLGDTTLGFQRPLVPLAGNLMVVVSALNHKLADPDVGRYSVVYPHLLCVLKNDDIPNRHLWLGIKAWNTGLTVIRCGSWCTIGSETFAPAVYSGISSRSFQRRDSSHRRSRPRDVAVYCRNP
ncbi:uncharacterized protein PHACADRAFT_158695 [Phanerochaete carnosa HHB-10118-sp]|uniref:Uncharacterized protein n=1 Tax=Phanerochaete carnosa (strain HHB-10118-sp) TaxID=650164 RepID=K5WE97_PHACS|nr:uncharacterized protein PHACADRAFT_158695 [Phanerochaete carnosa HHB-10118-sp]EKM57630.1 hypothetical protein PHACADRAFT_158695 [Phanerochaete carnosa HHB-10118-sp]